MVMYTGEDTKIIQRNYISRLGTYRPKFKISRTLINMEKILFFIFILSFLSGGILSIVMWTQKNVVQ